MNFKGAPTRRKLTRSPLCAKNSAEPARRVRFLEGDEFFIFQPFEHIFVQRHDGARVYDPEGDLCLFPRRKRPRDRTRAAREHVDVFPLFKHFPPIFLKIRAAYTDFADLSVGITEGDGTIERKRVGEHGLRLVVVLGREYFQIGDRTEIRGIEHSLMRLSVRARQPRPVHQKDDGQILDTHVVNDLVVRAL